MNRKTVSLDIAKWTAYLVSVLLILVTLRLISWSLQSTDVIQVNREPFPVLNKPVKKIDGVTIARVQLDFCKLQDVRSIENGVQPRLVSDKTEIDLKSYTDSVPKGCQQIEAPILLPPQAQPDTYHLEWYACYKLNPIKDNICETIKSEDFQLVYPNPPGVQGPQGVQGIQGIPGQDAP